MGAFAAELLRLAAKDAGAKEDAKSKEPGEGERRPTAIGPEHIVKALQQMGLSNSFSCRYAAMAVAFAGIVCE